MNKLLTDNSYSEPLLFKGAKTETKFSGRRVENKSGSCAQKSKAQDSGYTIIESLVAMIVVSVLMIAIAPVMAFSVAIRVQARRTELAAMAGRAYIDGLRAGSIKYGGTIKGFPTKSAQPRLADEPAPTSKDNLYCVDLDGGGCDPSSNKDFYVQGAWLNTDAGNDPTSKGYQLLVRVYRADSFAGGVTLKAPNAPGAIKQSIVGSGLGDKTMPVVEMAAEIPATGDTPNNLEPYKSLCSRLQTADPTKCQN
ncbi:MULTISPECIES: hormogonium polysaccharide secretion pseudopilin HpsB [unclassified Microcoleus]|uniref:hormogonium polysaccharide secretion pseudopilin HpsB n=1 Tax=unclassified Microcoleus TaxID=2642155 RepID=UPI002FCFBB84